MRKIFINYADGRRSFFAKQQASLASFRKFNEFDEYIGYNRQCLDSNFYVKNKHILDCSTGAGYWLWKSYIINKTLSNCQENDIVMYADCTISQIAPITELFRILIEETPGVMAFKINDSMGDERGSIKRDAFILMDCDKEEYFKETYHGAMSLFKCNDFSKSLVYDYLRYSQDDRILTDIPNTLGQPNYPIFNGSRHDQSIYSLLCKKHKLKNYVDPTQFGNPYREMFNCTYGQLLDHNR